MHRRAGGTGAKIHSELYSPSHVTKSCIFLEACFFPNKGLLGRKNPALTQFLIWPGYLEDYRQPCAICVQDLWSYVWKLGERERESCVCRLTPQVSATARAQQAKGRSLIRVSYLGSRDPGTCTPSCFSQDSNSWIGMEQPEHRVVATVLVLVLTCYLSLRDSANAVAILVFLVRLSAWRALHTPKHTCSCPTSPCTATLPAGGYLGTRGAVSWVAVYFIY